MPNAPLTPTLTRRDLWVGGLCALAVLVIWTSFILVARSSADRTLTSFDIAWLRFVFSGVLVLPWLAWRAGALRQALGGERATVLKRGGLLALTAGVGYCALAYSGFFFAPAAHAAVLMPGSLPLWTALLAVWLLGERLGRWRIAGLALIVTGGALVGGSSLLQAFDGGNTWIGDALFLAAGASWSLYGVLCRRWRIGAVDATVAIALGCLVSYVPLYGLAVATGLVPTGLGRTPWAELAAQAVFQGGVTMLLAGVAYTRAVQTFGPVRTTMVTALVPGLAALAAVPLLGEALGPAALAGLVCVTAGLLLGLRSGRAPAAIVPTSTPTPAVRPAPAA
jgi:drug/metabolite transporter (DMT)-like permease